MTGTEFRDRLHTLERYVIAFEESVHQFMLALLSGSHMILFGAPGTGKSTAMRLYTGTVAGAATFRTQVTADTIPDHLIGSPIPRIYLDEGRYIRHLEGGLMTAHLAGVDELTDAAVWVARSLNTVLNERMLESKDQSAESPLITAIFTANSFPRATEWVAFLDRVMFRFHPKEDLTPLELDSVARISQAQRGRPPDLNLVTLEELQDLREQVAQVQITPGVRLLAMYLAHRYREEMTSLPRSFRETLSPRTCARLLTVLQAQALLDGKSRVSYSHLPILENAICTMGAIEEGAAERALFRRIHEDIRPRFAEDERTFDELGELKDRIDALVADQRRPELELSTVRFSRWLKRATLVPREQVHHFLAQIAGHYNRPAAETLFREIIRSAERLGTRAYHG
jgi:MoxR-like ATPase